MARRRNLFPSSPAASTVPTHCPYHEPPVELERRQFGLWCPAGQGYPLFIRREEACPMCRRPLEWDGGCFACHGTETGQRADWVFPGQRYDHHEEDGTPIGDGQHWVKVMGPPGRPALTKEDYQSGLAAIQRVFAQRGYWRRG